jgi:hypothetical protein
MSDYTPIHVNFTDDEASSEARSFDPLPRGKYPVKITDGELREVKSGKNEGRPYWNIEFTVQEGNYADRRVWTNVMLFDGALYSLSQLLKATGHEDSLKDGVVPPLDAFIGEAVVINVIQREYEGEKRNEVKGIMKPDAISASSGSSSLLP